MDFQQGKDQFGDVIEYKCVPKVYLLYDESDTEKIRKFKENFIDINYISISLDKKSLYLIDQVDYFLVFLSEKSLKNRVFLNCLLENYIEKFSQKIIGLIIDDKLKKNTEKRFEIYRYYKEKFIEATKLISEGIVNEDVRANMIVYSQGQKIGDFIADVIRTDGTTTISAEDKFELYLEKDNRIGLRFKHTKENPNDIDERKRREIEKNMNDRNKEAISKTAEQRGITNNFYSTVNGVQLQQGNVNAKQSQTIGQESIDYEAIKKVIMEIKKSDDLLPDTYGNETTTVRNIISEVTSLAEQKKEPKRIKAALLSLKDLSIGITGNLIASGIVQLISTLNL